MNNKPLLYDLYCCAGGASVGYSRAGFRVVGVDKDFYPSYPYEMIVSDVLDFLQEYLDGKHPDADAFHASPPCQFASNVQNLGRARNGGKYPATHRNLIEPTRELLQKTGIPYVIENVSAAKKYLINPVMLCGVMFPELRVYRHRYFESSVPLCVPKHVSHNDQTPSAGNGPSPKGYISVCGTGGVRGMKAQEIIDYWQKAMGIDWMFRRKELAEALPPVYTEYIGRQFILYMRRHEMTKETCSFHWDGASKVWFLAGQDANGNAWETDNYHASNRDEALYNAAEYRVDYHDELQPYRDFILSDWPEGEDHWLWVTSAPIDEILSWAKAGGRA